MSTLASSKYPLDQRAVNALFAIYIAIGVVSVAGYAAFALRPENLARFGQVEWVQGFYGIAFEWLARVHIVVACVLLATWLTRRLSWTWLPVLGSVSFVALAVEYLGTTTGIPFGEYQYTTLLGPKLFGHVPVVIPLSWFAMAVPAFVLAGRRFPQQRMGRVLLGAALLTSWDLSLDPAMSYLTSYWVWSEPGQFYGMPLVNLLGWFVTSVLIMLVLDHSVIARRRMELAPRVMGLLFISTLIVPVGMVAAAGLWSATIVATIIPLAGLAFAMRRTSSDELPQTSPELAPQSQDLDAFFRMHSRSFWFASRWFNRSQRVAISRVYAYCRTTDDIVDCASDKNSAEQALEDWAAKSRAAYAGESTGVDWLDKLMTASREADVPFALVEDLLAGVRSDLGTVRVADWQELSRYCYRVGSVVGLWICRLFGITDPAVLDRARALGHAMQLTNITRDVGEDLSINRIYLPATLLDQYGVAEADLRSMHAVGRPSPEYRVMMADLAGRTEALYAFAETGIPALPPGFRSAVAVASRVYHGIGIAVRRADWNNLSRRARTSFVQKIILAAKALWWLRSAETDLSGSAPPGAFSPTVQRHTELSGS